MKRNQFVLRIVLLAAFLVLSGMSLSGAEPGKKILLCTPQAVADMDFFLEKGAAKSDVFRVNSSGELEITGSQFGYLATKEHYRNFTIHGEYSLPDPKVDTNSGFLVRISGPSPTGTFLPRCVEVQIMRTVTGDLFGFHGLVIQGAAPRYVTGKAHEFAGDYCHVKKFRNIEKSGKEEWNTFDLTCIEDLIVVCVNGKIANWCSGVACSSGPVAFQSEGGPARFRNVTLTVLP